MHACRSPRVRPDGSLSSNMLSSCRIASSLSHGVWEGSMTQYATLGKRGSTEMLGLLTGVSGICTLLVAVPSGIASDRWRRDGVLRIFGVVENRERPQSTALMPLHPHIAEKQWQLVSNFSAQLARYAADRPCLASRLGTHPRQGSLAAAVPRSGHHLHGLRGPGPQPAARRQPACALHLRRRRRGPRRPAAVRGHGAVGRRPRRRQRGAEQPRGQHADG